MEHIARLHYAYRILLLLVHHLKTFGPVKAECGFVCCHVAELRVILTTPQQPHNNCLRAIVIRVRAPAALATIMKPTAVTRYTITNEILRRRKQIESDNTPRPPPQPEQRTDLISITFEDIPAATQRSERRMKQRVTFTEPSESSTADEPGNVEPTMVHTSPLTNTKAPSGKLPQYWAMLAPQGSLKLIRSY